MQSKQNTPMHPDRRQVLGFGGAALGLAALGQQSILPVPLRRPRSLVCIQLAGGNDGYNMLVPRSAPQYAIYAGARQGLAVQQSALLPITPATPDGTDYGVHPAMPEVQALFQAGKLAFLPSVGTLLEPTTKAEILAGTKHAPPQLFSHEDQQRSWALPAADLLGGPGWGGLVSDLLAPAWNPGSPDLGSVSLRGSAPLLIGPTSAGYALGVEGPVSLAGFDDPLGVARKAVFDAILQASQPCALQREFSRVLIEAQKLAAEIASALLFAPSFTTPFDPQSHLARQLLMVARLIAVQQDPGIGRQFFLTLTGGFDTHDEQVYQQPLLLADISRSIASFQGAMAELGREDDVVLFTTSEFGRSLTSNGNGSDHGWAAPHMVVGGSVRGGDLYGRFPDQTLGGPDDLGCGRFVSDRSVDQLAATLARWFGAKVPELYTLFPNLASFPAWDLGFL